jgi:hypothetical protein
MKLLPNSKKARALIASVLVLIIGNVLTHLGVELTPEQSFQLNELTGLVVSLITGVYMLAQGIADGQSGGKTSANYLGDISPPQEPRAGDELDKVANMFNKLNLKVTGTKKD